MNLAVTNHHNLIMSSIHLSNSAPIPSGSAARPPLAMTLASILVLGTAGALQAQDSRHEFSVNGRFTFNVDSRVQNVATPQNPGPPTGGGLDRFYDDGFNRVDSSSNSGGKTWFWGYQNTAQYNVGLDAIEMNSMNSPRDGSSQRYSDGAHAGVDISYRYAMGRFDMGGRSASWGLESGVGYMDLSLRDSDRFNGTLTRITDRFALDGVVPPAAPYSGSFAGPGALLDDAPNQAGKGLPARTVAINPADSNQRVSFAGDLFALKLGPYLRVPLSDRVWCQFSGGLALVHSSMTFSFSETVTETIPGGLTRTVSGSRDRSEWMPGGYLEAQLGVQLSRHWNTFLGAQYQNVGSSSISATGKTGTLELGQTFSVLGGLGFSF